MMTRVWLIFSTIFGLGSTTCPWNETGLASFATTFPSINPTSDITINQTTLLDVTSVSVNTIVISGYGSLVLQPGSDVNITTRSIRIMDNGSLIIGSAQCRYNDSVDIKLFGNRTTNRTTLSERGEKFISLEDNATLSIYGQDKLSWTKLTATANKSTPDYSLQGDSTRNKYKQFVEGFAVMIFNSTLDVVNYEVYDIYKDSLSQAETQVRKMNNSLSALPNGRILAIAVHNYLKIPTGLDMTQLYNTVEDRCGMSRDSLSVRDAAMNDSFALICETGSMTANFDQNLDEHIGKHVTEARASIEVGGKKVSAISQIEPGKKVQSKVDFLVSSLSEGYPVINVAHNVSDQWSIGDSIVLASTDYSWENNEVRKIKSFPSATSIQLDHELDYRHFGEIEEGVDMRGEVAMLTRNIKIHAELSPTKYCPEENGNCDQFTYDTYGCHIKILYNFAYFHLEGVEMYFAGQPIDKGFYPVHFHMCEDVTDKEVVVKRNSIHNAFRAVVIHGTYGTSETQLGVEVIENVAYDILGHCYFQEDGSERATSFIRNFGASIKKVINNFFVSDASTPTIFWIVTPETVMIDNVAAGSESTGIWYLFPNSPVGPSASLAIYGSGQALKTPLYTNDNNIMHSNDRAGFFFDNTLLNDDGEVTGGMRYDPLVDPLNPNSAKKQVFLYRMTAYKNRGINIWLRGGGLYIMHASMAESRRGAQFANGGPQHQYMSHSVIIGESTGNNEYSSVNPRAYGREQNSLQQFDRYLGFVWYDGPVWISKIFFSGFAPKPNNELAVGALGFKPNNKFGSSPVSSGSELRFGGNDPTEMNWVYDGNPDEDEINGYGNQNGDEVATFRDADRSVVKCPGDNHTGMYQVHKPEHFIRTERTIYRPNWKMSWSTDLYGKLQSVVNDGPSNFNPAVEMERIDRRNESDRRYENSPMTENKEFMVVLGRTNDFYYRFQYENDFPNQITVTGKGVERDQYVIGCVCLPEGTTTSNFSVMTFRPNDIYANSDNNDIKWVNSLEELEADTTMSRLYLDGRFLCVKFINDLERDSAWDSFDDDHCPTACPFMKITMNTATTSYTKCFSTTPDQLNYDISIGTEETCTMPKSTREPAWGALDTLSDRDGGWSDWTSWSDCCNTNSSNPVQTTRTRTCTFPTPYGNGASCTGVSTETKDCETSCPVNGSWSEWAAWTSCGCAEGSSGERSRSRTCEGVANGGYYCAGVSVEVESCTSGCSPVDGSWTTWTSWTDCACQNGSSGARTRYRECHGATNGGLACTGARNETQTCTTNC